MRRPLHAWLLYALCVLVVLATLGGLTLTALHLDEVGRRAEMEAETEGRIRLALWRADSALALLVAQENSRPWTDFAAFHPPETLVRLDGSVVQDTTIRIPSPILLAPVTNLLLHFRLDPDGTLTSPAVPRGSERALAAALGLDAQTTVRASRELARLDLLLRDLNPADGNSSARISRYGLSRSATGVRGWMRLAEAAPESSNAPTFTEPAPPSSAAELSQSALNRGEQRARAYRFNNTVADYGQQAQQAPKPGPVAAAEVPTVGRFAGVRLGGELFLVRRIRFRAGWWIDGVWLDWPGLRGSLRSELRDLLPEADLTLASDSGTDTDERRLVALPVRLEPGTVPLAPPHRWTPLRLTLALAWAGAGMAALAIGLLLAGTLALSERRAAFVSAVTHELRTPLTTFQMYSEMLAGDMVPDPVSRRSYLETLRSEAVRLGHLVENVLAYARLERGSARGRVETLTVRELLARTRERLDTRAAAAGLELRLDEVLLDSRITTDVSVTEQILFNLVDNAAKYAGPAASEPRIDLSVFREGTRWTCLRVCDHGPGIPEREARKLFRPFSRSSEEAAGGVPGVGLGLALSRRLARDLGGDLLLVPSREPGATFVLKVPSARTG
jgi:signal transduction histidine kinase